MTPSGECASISIRLFFTEILMARFGSPSPQNRKRHFVLVDGILAGEGSGPMNPDPVSAGIVLFGVHPPSVDAVCAYLMGFDPGQSSHRPPGISVSGSSAGRTSWKDIVVNSNHAEWNRPLNFD